MESEVEGRPGSAVSRSICRGWPADHEAAAGQDAMLVRADDTAIDPRRTAEVVAVDDEHALSFCLMLKDRSPEDLLGQLGRFQQPVSSMLGWRQPVPGPTQPLHRQAELSAPEQQKLLAVEMPCGWRITRTVVTVGNSSQLIDIPSGAESCEIEQPGTSPCHLPVDRTYPAPPRHLRDKDVRSVELPVKEGGGLSGKVLERDLKSYGDDFHHWLQIGSTGISSKIGCSIKPETVKSGFIGDQMSIFLSCRLDLKCSTVMHVSQPVGSLHPYVDVTYLVQLSTVNLLQEQPVTTGPLLDHRSIALGSSQSRLAE